MSQCRISLAKIFTSLLVLMLSATAYASQETAEAAEKAFLPLSQEYFTTYYFPEDPASATASGIHLYDDKLADDSKAGIARKITRLQQFEARLSAIDPKVLSQPLEADYELLLNHLKSKLLTLQVIKPWQKNPDYYSSALTYSAFVIIERQFAPLDTRLRALIAREKAMPVVLLEAHQNLQNPPKIYTEIALEQLPGMISFFQKDVPAAFSQVKDPQLIEQFREANTAVIAALQDYQRWLKNTVLAQSHGDFRLGKEVFQKKLQYDEMVDLPLKKLLAINMKNMRENQREFLRISKTLYPHKSKQAVLAELAKSHSTRSALLKDFNAQFDNLIEFITTKKIIIIPSDVRPIMEETPPFLRAITLASMDTPGPFEKIAKEAYFNVTLPDLAWGIEKQNKMLEMFNYPAMSSIAIHEAYPGHYTQFLWLQTQKDPIRKILGAASNAEGWAHYCEQMMLDEGFGANNTQEAQLLRLGQLDDALLRNARFTVGIKLHTGQMTFNQAINFFVKEGYQSPMIGLIETKRGTMDPTYLYYTLGKLQILKLRADLQRKEGSAFNLEKFHNDFMRQGFPPIKIVRKALLEEDSPTLN